jgi:hypothetical protein
VSEIIDWSSTSESGIAPEFCRTILGIAKELSRTGGLLYNAETRQNTTMSRARRRGENDAEKEKAMVPMEGFAALGGHAAAVNRIAHSRSEADERWTIGQPVAVRVVVTEVSTRDRILGWVGDLFLSAGTWLKTRLAVASYQRA